MSVFFRKFGVSSGQGINIPLIKRASVDFVGSADYVPGSGDVRVCIDNGAVSNINSLPVFSYQGSGGFWRFAFTNSEYMGKKIDVTVTDAASKACEDQMFTIETYGSSLAMYQADWSAPYLPSVANSIAANALNEAAFHADTAKYQARMDLRDDDTGTSDRYVIVWHKDSQPVTTTVSNAQIRVIKVADGSELLSVRSMTPIGSTQYQRYTETASRIIDGVGYIAEFHAVIDASSRVWPVPFGRDS
jgi:hypothetical protein